MFDIPNVLLPAQKATPNRRKWRISSIISGLVLAPAEQRAETRFQQMLRGATVSVDDEWVLGPDLTAVPDYVHSIVGAVRLRLVDTNDGKVRFEGDDMSILSPDIVVVFVRPD